MSVDSVEENYAETVAVDGSIASLISVDALGTFELDHDLLVESTESISAEPTGAMHHVMCYVIFILAMTGSKHYDVVDTVVGRAIVVVMFW